MGVFIVYIIESAIYLSVFYSFNKLLLGKETIHQFNRMMWLCILSGSLLLPLCNFSVLHFTFGEMSRPDTFFAQAEHAVDMGVTGSEKDSLYFTVRLLCRIYFTGALIMLIGFSISYIKLFRFICFSRPADLREEELLQQCKEKISLSRRVKLRVHDCAVSPFTWMNYVVISASDLQKNEKEILIHELLHIKFGHSYDMVLAEVMLLLQWFNPVGWFMKRDMRRVHEYQVDDNVIRLGIDAQQYQLLLIRKAVGEKRFIMANGFDHSNLKNRINMMLKKKSRKWVYVKCMYAFPLAFLAMSASAAPQISSKLEKIASISFNQTPKENEVVSESTGDPILTIPGAEVDVAILSSNKSEKINKEKVTEAPEGLLTDTLPPVLSNDKSNGDRLPVAGEVLCVVKNIPQEQSFVKIVPKPREENGKIWIKGKKLKSLQETGNDPLYVVNNVEVKSLPAINPNEIRSISILKNTEIIKQYGAKAKNGVILVTLKSNSNNKVKK